MAQRPQAVQATSQSSRISSPGQQASAQATQSRWLHRAAARRGPSGTPRRSRRRRCTCSSLDHRQTRARSSDGVEVADLAVGEPRQPQKQPLPPPATSAAPPHRSDEAAVAARGRRATFEPPAQASRATRFDGRADVDAEEGGDVGRDRSSVPTVHLPGCALPSDQRPRRTGRQPGKPQAPQFACPAAGPRRRRCEDPPRRAACDERARGASPARRRARRAIRPP